MKGTNGSVEREKEERLEPSSQSPLKVAQREKNGLGRRVKSASQPYSGLGEVGGKRPGKKSNLMKW